MTVLEMTHHASCRPEYDLSLIWQCQQCGAEASAEDLRPPAGRNAGHGTLTSPCTIGEPFMVWATGGLCAGSLHLRRPRY